MVLVLSATASAATVLGYLLQLAETVAASGFSAKPSAEFETGLFEQDRSLLGAGELLGHNALVYGGFLLCGLLLAGWRPHRAVRLGRLSVGFIVSVFMGYAFWRLAVQNASVAAQIHGPRLFLMLALPHGPLEFGALLTPIVSGLWPRSVFREIRTRQVRNSIAVGVALLIAAAVVECWISPVLLSIPVGAG